MYYVPHTYQCPYYVNVPMYNYGRQVYGDERILLTDYGPESFVVNINEATKQNNTYRTAL